MIRPSAACHGGRYSPPACGGWRRRLYCRGRPPPRRATSGPVGVTQPGTTAAEFRARFAQTGPTGEALHRVRVSHRADGASDDDLFAALVAQNDTTALLTAYAEGDLVRRTVDQSVHSLDIEGTLTIYQRAAPGASFADPASFTEGTPVATFAITLQDIVTVFAPGKGLPDADRRHAADAVRQAQRPGARPERSATSARRRGCLPRASARCSIPRRFNSILEMAGNWTTK